MNEIFARLNTLIEDMRACRETTIEQSITAYHNQQLDLENEYAKQATALRKATSLLMVALNEMNLAMPIKG
jgi:hypothetical protein